MVTDHTHAGAGTDLKMRDDYDDIAVIVVPAAHPCGYGGPTQLNRLRRIQHVASPLTALVTVTLLVRIVMAPLDIGRILCNSTLGAHQIFRYRAYSRGLMARLMSTVRAAYP